MVGTVQGQIEFIAPLLPPVAGTDVPRGPSPAVRSDQAAAGADGAKGQIPQAPPPNINDHELRLTINSETHEVIAQVIDPQTNQVIREIPPEDMRKASEVIRSLLGKVVDKFV
jgi:hypothetical protein